MATLHVAFANIWDILVKLHLLCSIFQKVRKSWLDKSVLQTLYMGLMLEN